MKNYTLTIAATALSVLLLPVVSADFGDDTFGRSSAPKRIDSGNYYTIKNTTVFKIKKEKVGHKSNDEFFGSSKGYTEHGHKEISHGKKLYLKPAEYPGIAYIHNNKGQEWFIKIKDVGTLEEYKKVKMELDKLEAERKSELNKLKDLEEERKKELKALKEEKKKHEEFLRQWEEFSKTLKPCPTKGEAYVLHKAPAFIYITKAQEYMSIGENAEIKMAFLIKQDNANQVAILDAAAIVAVIGLETHDSTRIAKVITTSGDTLYMDPATLRAKP